MKSKKNKLKVYCGPSFNGELEQFQVFRGDMPSHIQHHLDECEDIERLTVPIDKLTSVKEKIDKQGTREHSLYRNILKYREEV